ncbi:MAG: type II toxin-antitoxin system RelE/ParE family toxin [Gammaproteobacteria bacterium]|nr:type II toxin-antitoxin system RelE/ParE family toxin [Gammaproteobacteria bacterium]
MIKSFKHKGLQKFYETSSVAGVQSKHKQRLRMILVALDSSLEIDDMDVPGFKLHPLKGRLKGVWSVSVSGNWRVTFEFENGNSHIVNYEDYH